MEFADRVAYDAYNAHADHVAFVQGRWLPEVEAFLELDSEALAELRPSSSLSFASDR